MNIKEYKSTEDTSKADKWFDEMSRNLKYDHQIYRIDALPKEQKAMYDTLISGNVEDILAQQRTLSSAYFIKKIIDSYLYELANFNANPLKLGLDLSNSKVLVWAEIKEDDENTEKALILSQAKVNAWSSDLGFNIDTTIIEDVDKLPIPNHYNSIEIV